MYLKKVNIENYKCFKGKFSLELDEGLNIIVGNNEAGKSTIIEAVHLALSGHLNGRYLMFNLTQYLFNNEIEKEYIQSLATTSKNEPPFILIEVFIAGENLPFFEGDGNSEHKKECCITFRIEFAPQYQGEYEKLIETGSVLTIPIEYYKITWRSCAREAVTSRSIPIKSVLIDSSSSKFQNGSDVYISRIIRNDLDEKERVGVSQAYRRLKESFMQEDSIKAINKKIVGKAGISDKEIKISIDLSTKDAWENSLMTYLDDIPFHQIGKGEQCIIKTNLALGHRKTMESNLILIEEPENHLSHSKLNQFVNSIQNKCEGKQIVISTHNSFVANKLGLDKLHLLHNQRVVRLIELNSGTQDFFRKLPGFNTLRIILCKKAILVEGPSDELVVQKAYMMKHTKLPIENEIDIISVGMTFKRFLEIASKIAKPVAVVTDNDGDYDKKITEKYKDFASFPTVEICADNNDNLRTLEYQMADANKDQLAILCKAIGIDGKKFSTQEAVRDYMLENKTSWTLALFDSALDIKYPSYIERVIAWCSE